MEEKKHYDNIDLLKFFAILSIISIHIPLFNYDLTNARGFSDKLQFAIKVLTQMVPLFFAINGFLLLGKNEFNINKHIKKLIKLGLIFIIWSLILILINLIYDKTTFDRSVIIDLFLNTKSGSLYTGELWFLQALFAVYVIYPLLWFVYKNQIKLFEYIFIVLLAYNVFTNTIEIFNVISLNSIRIKQANDLLSLLNRFSMFGNYSWFLMYFMLGGIIKHYYQQIYNKKILISLVTFSVYVIALFVSYYVSGRDSYPCELFDSNSSILDILLVTFYFAISYKYRCNSVVSKFVTDIGTNTLGIYLTHSFILRIARLPFDQNIFSFRLLSTIITLTLCYVLTKLMKKIPYIKELFNL